MFRSRASAASVVIGAGLAAVAFGASGGTELGRTTVVEVLLLLAGAAGVAAVILYGRPASLHGASAVLLLGALAALTAISITWSIAPELSFVDAGRMLAYLAVFAAAVGAAWVAPRGSPALLKGLLLGALAVVAYALASRVWPGSLAEDELSGRIGQPYGYWNAVGTTAAMLVPGALWLGSRRSGSPAGNALAYPLLGLAILAVLLTQSRGALAAGLAAAALWFAFVPLRLRSLPVALIAAAGAAPVAAWALSKDAFARGLQPLAAKESVAGEFGLLLLLMSAALLLAGLAVGLALGRRAPRMYVRRRIGIAAVVATCAVPLVLLTSVAFSSRGLGGTISKRVDELTSEAAAQPAEGAGRFAATSNSRAAFWREAGKVFADRRGLGTGAATFGLARLRYRKTEQVSRHAHGFWPQTLADLGIVGLVLSLALLAAWGAAAGRTTGLWGWLGRRAPRHRRDWTPERCAVAALALSALAFGLQSAIDWTWFVPGPAVMALVSAGFVAGRGPLSAAAGPLPAANDPATRQPPPTPPRELGLGSVRLALPVPARLLGAAGVAVTALLCAWAVWQPERSDRLSARALELIERDDLGRAASEAAKAEDVDPLSPKPLLVQASVQSAAGNDREALHDLERAVLRFPGEPQTWIRLASFQLLTLDRPADALSSVRGALYLDPESKAARRLFLDARSALRQRRLELLARRRRVAEREVRADTGATAQVARPEAGPAIP